MYWNIVLVYNLQMFYSSLLYVSLVAPVSLYLATVSPVVASVLLANIALLASLNILLLNSQRLQEVVASNRVRLRTLSSGSRYSMPFLLLLALTCTGRGGRWGRRRLSLDSKRPLEADLLQPQDPVGRHV